MVQIAVISLTTPLMLWGLGLLTLPIAAHLLNRQARRRIIFPTIRLLQQSAATQSRLFRLRRLIMLALRCLAVVAIAWAFARPVWTDARPPSAGNSDSNGVVLLIDTSASAGQQTGGVSAMNAIGVAAQRTLDSLRSGIDVADIVFANAQPEAMFGQLSPNFAALRGALQALQPTAERAELTEAIALAGRILARHDGQRRMIVLSDLQASNWNNLAGSKSIGELLPRDTKITFVDAANVPVDNVSLHHPRSFPAQPIVGQPLQLAVMVENFASHESQARISITIDQQPSGSQTVSLLPLEQREVTFGATFDDGANHEIVFAIGSDALEADNRAFLVIKAVQHVPVALIGDDDRNEPGSAAYFLSRALAPRGDQSDQYEIRRVPSGEVTSTKIADCAAVFVTDIGALQQGAAEEMLKYVNAGGGIVWFCGEGPVGQNLMMLDGLNSPGGVLPWVPGTLRNLAAVGNVLAINSGAWQSRLLQAFDERSQIALSQISFRRVLAVNELRPDARVLLTFNDGTPALASRIVGNGQMLLANFSPSLRSSDLGRYGAFVALMQSLANDLQPQHDIRAQAVVGEPFEFAPQPFSSSGLQAIGPDGNVVTAAELRNAQSKLVVNLPRPAQPGFYRLNRDGQTVAVAAINIDPRESDLRRTDIAALTQQLQAAGSALEIKGLDDSGPIVRLRGMPLWDWFIAAAMIAIALELVMIGIFRR